MRILITGGTGFIGTHLVLKLLEKGHDVTTLSRRGRFVFDLPVRLPGRLSVIKGDIADASLLSELLGGQDLLIHNASAVGAQASINTGEEFLSSNVGGTNSLATVLATKSHSLKHVILGSSISVYGEGNYLCIKCGAVRPGIRKVCDFSGTFNPQCPSCCGALNPALTPETAATNGEHLYAVTKKYQEEILALTARSIDLPLTIFRYATVLGGGQRPSNPYMQMLKLLLSGEAPVIFEDGGQTRDFIEVSEVVRANLLAIQNYRPGVNIYNIGSGRTLSLLDFMHHLIGVLEVHLGLSFKTPVVTNQIQQGDVRHCNIDCSKANRELKFDSALDLDTGLERFIGWYLRALKGEQKNIMQSHSGF